MNYTELIQQAQQLLKGARTGGRLDPARDWLVLLAALAALLCISFFWNLWIFFSVVQTDMQATRGEVEEGSAYTLDALETLLQEREQERARYESEYGFVDPSL